MSTPAEQERQRERLAADTAVSAASAIGAARTSLGLAGEAADRLNRNLDRCLGAIDDLRSDAGGVRDPRNETAQSVETVKSSAQGVKQRLTDAQRELDVVHKYLVTGAAPAIAAGRKFLDQVQQVPGHRSEMADQLGHRLDSLHRAVQSSIAGLRRASSRIAKAQRRVESVPDLFLRDEDRERTASEIDDRIVRVDRIVSRVHGGIEVLGENVAGDGENARKVGKDISALADAIRAGMRPPTSSAQTEAGSAVEDRGAASSEGRGEHRPRRHPRVNRGKHERGGGPASL